jgi:carboxypeptidase Q
MRRFPRVALLVTALAAAFTESPSRAAQTNWLDAYRGAAGRIIAETQATPFAWNRLAELTDTFGNRLSGSKALEEAIRWAVAEMRKDGLDNVHTEPVMVPHWVRGAESVEIVSPVRQRLTMLGLGNSVGTPPEGIEADALVVSSFQDLERQAARVRGRVVVFNVPFTTYGETVQYRAAGPSRAAALGAVAVLVRSVGPPGLRTPHTGALQYAADQPKIPAAAITVEDAERFQRLQARGVTPRLRLKMEARFLPDAESANVVAELRGRERPDEIVVVGGHFDSWDVGTGATDDGGGCIATWEALRILKTLNLRPRRTLRVVLFTNEENGLRGALAYRDRHRDELANHVLMLESDGGVFRPTGFGFTGSDAARATVEEIARLLAPLGADRIGPGGGGADIGPSMEAGNIPGMSLQVGGDYFLIHHTPADTVDKISPDDIARAAAAITIMAYVIADMPDRLGTVTTRARE